MKLKVLTLTLVLAGIASMFSACGSTTSNVSVNTGARNMNANSNVAVLVNNNANMVTSTNRWSNTNVNRADYDKNKSDYEKDKGSSTIGSGANDSWLWFKTRAAMLTTSDLRESTINVDVANDVVTLTGSVANAAQKTKAEQVAKGIDGVKSVKNNLKIAANDSMTNSHSNTSNMNKK
ncbi:MAG: BON domain-containing protein [Pyrinomonadaceae bacterium]